MNRYDSYKDSGIDWIGKIPSHWMNTKYKFHTNILSGFPFKSELFDNEEGFPILRIRDITSGSSETYYKGDYQEEYLIKRGDLLIGMDGDFNIRWWNNFDVLLNQRCCSIKEFDTVYRRFLFYVLPFDLRVINDLTYYTTVKHLSNSDIYNSSLVIPPLPEQQQIVAFLDEKTALIDSLLEKTKQKIALLKEKRMALINEVVTKGLDPNVAMKDSGVEWIGEIPSHWEMKKVKYLIEEKGGIKIGPFGSSLKLNTLTEEGIKVYGQGNVIKDDFTLGHRHIPLDRFNADFKQYEIIEGDILITMMGTTGKSKVFKRDYKRGILDSHLLRLRFNRTKFLSELFVVILQEGDYVYNQLSLSSKGSIMQGLNSSIVKELSIVTSSISEQHNISKYLEEQTQLIDDTIGVEEKRIELLKEYRQSLISEVVTGKRKVVN